ncbi:uroporphyrinogen-III synthase [Microcella humidisoli]|jgi:uroporphyrinogen-III synthase|uniref:Uroporphyrinogen-III synthase n=1 Tax=Microcella humidisoli TaxID=2963406 RepID=A0ABY5FZ12_9MICO|nr:uroporphyrinogen-III synthase [Microcella humidisoli]UTT63563.1 uroporphyrinogen-III synthase [Microcella humidisoli]
MEEMFSSLHDVTIERTPTGALPVIKPLLGWTVLVPRGGKWGDGVAAQLRALGAVPVIAPLINFAGTEHPEQLSAALERLQSGAYGWLVVTSATTVDVLVGHDVRVPATTRIAAVGETTAHALQLAGYSVDFVPSDHSARGLVREWPGTAAQGAVLVPQSEIAEPTLVSGLADRGIDAQFVSAYRTVGVTAPAAVVADVAAGRIRGLIVSSGSVARQIAEQFAPLPEGTVVVCIGPRTAFDARAAGLTVHRIADERSTAALVRALAEYAMNPDDSVPPVVS